MTVCILAYGDFPELIERCLSSLYRHTPVRAFRLRVGMNEPSAATRRCVFGLLAGRTNIDAVHQWTPQIYKYPAMRHMFYAQPLCTDWVMWLDDDSFIDSDAWLIRAARVIDRKFDQKPASSPLGHRMFGKIYYSHLDEGQQDWIRQAPWYRHRPVRMDNSTQPPLPKSDFVTGGYWLVTTEALRTCDWPDRRLRHNGGDIMMGEALHQAGYGMAEASHGIQISTAARRGFVEGAAGSVR